MNLKMNLANSYYERHLTACSQLGQTEHKQ